MFYRAVATIALVLLVGCQPWAPAAPGPLVNLPFGQQQAVVPNPVFIPVVDQDFAWEQIVDVVDDFFRVSSERRVELVGDVITEGQVATFPRVGATILEPHRGDSVGRYNRWESTLQTIRRSACVRVIPDRGGYLVEVVVQKELEDLPRPEQATGAAATFRNDSSLDSRVGEEVSPLHYSNAWIPLGRDVALEQCMLSEIQRRASGG